MKEVTEWNGKPRWMWVWDDDINAMQKKFVVYIASSEECKNNMLHGFHVIVLGCVYKHCAEIKGKRPCTGGELLEMLKKQGLPLLQRCRSVFNLVTVARISTVSVEMSNGEYCTYLQLCENYTLLDGTELWKEN